MTAAAVPIQAAEARTDIVRRLLGILDTLEVLLDETRVGEFLCRALKKVQGIADVKVCIRGRLVPADKRFQAICRQSEQAWDNPDAVDWSAVASEADALYFPVRSEANLFGVIIVICADKAALLPYADFIGRIAAAVAMILDARLTQSKLAVEKVRLRDAQAEIDVRIAERTLALTSRNRELAQEVEERKRLGNALAERERVRLYELAYLDQLTGLLSRQAFEEGLSAALATADQTGEAVAVIAIAIEQFGRLGDSLGYRGTNDILRAVGDRLKGASADTQLVGRGRGDRFHIVLPCLRSEGELDRQVRAIAGLLGSAFTVAGQKFILRFRVGVATYPAGASSMEMLMLQAEAAGRPMSDAASRQKPVYHSRELAAQLRRLMTIEEGLRGAIDAKQFHLVYQPRGRLRDGAAIGVESLLRWSHPSLGNVSPAEFIPVAEESGVIAQIGAWVIHHACRQLGAWKAEGVPLVPVSVNLTMRDLLSPATPELIAAELRAAGLAPDLLEVEITEGTAMLDVEATKAFMDAMRALGVRCIIDDFGTGYSSLAYLFDLPFSTLKIDKRFVDRIQESKARKLVRSIVSMAGALGFDVVAEGVEYEYQSEFLRTCDCDAIQGYLYSRPVSAAALPAFLRAHQDPAPSRLPSS
jgi:diguanylate cyclase (GGDEF)-like protein